MNKNKVRQAVAIGVIAWLLGFIGVMLLIKAPAFPFIVIMTVLLGAPLPAWFVSWRFLAGIREKPMSLNALAFSAIVLLIQFVLDGLFAASVLLFNTPHLEGAAINGVFIALEIGYLYILVIPWIIGRRLDRSR